MKLPLVEMNNELLKMATDTHEALQLLHAMGEMSYMQTKTPRGYHHYYKDPGGIRPAVSVAAHGLDIRGDDSYLVAPGSVVDGKVYEELGAWDVTQLFEFDPNWLVTRFGDSKRGM